MTESERATEIVLVIKCSLLLEGRAYSRRPEYGQDILQPHDLLPQMRWYFGQANLAKFSLRGGDMEEERDSD